MRTFTGDLTGIVDVISGTRVYTHEGSTRMRATVNYIVRKGGELILPLITDIAGRRQPALEVFGAVFGVSQMRIHVGRYARLRSGGHSGCFKCASQYLKRNQYWFDAVIVQGGAKLEMISAVQDVSRATKLYTRNVVVEYNGLVSTDAIDMTTKFAKVDYDGRIDTSGRGWTAGNGPGEGRSGCGGSVGGAGHGGRGGIGSGCACSSDSSRRRRGNSGKIT